MPSRLRQYRLDDARDRVLGLAKLRPPQRDAFNRIHELLSQFDDDVARLPQDEIVRHLQQRGFDIPAAPPQFVFALATGVGKTRLMGALLSYLYNAQQSKHCLILAPRTTIIEKLERESQIGHPKYLFIDPTLVPEANLCFRNNMESFRPDEHKLNILILSPQSITGRDRRFARGSEFRGFSLFDYLSNVKDLIVFVDEAHHLGAVLGDEPAAWMAAVSELKPRLYFGFTATPRIDPGVNTLCTYDLATCLREGIYTKAVDLIVEKRDEAVPEEDWDRSTIDFALHRLERKRYSIREHTRSFPNFPAIEPVLLICAKDTDHAEEVGAWLKNSRGLTEEEMLITHSERARTEEDIQRLVAIDQPGNRIRVVVNVFQLTEGWDVTNVFVIAPLRAMATFRGAIQTMGRGLRLPMGRRTGDRDVDTLDVLCCGRESFEEILRQATEEFGSNEGQPGITVKSQPTLEIETPVPTKQIAIKACQEVRVTIPTVRAVYGEPPLDFDIENMRTLARAGATALHLDTLERTGLNEGLNYSYADFVASVHARVLAELRYLSDPIHGQQLEGLIQRFLESLGAKPEQQIATDPVRVALLIADEIDKRYRRAPLKYEVTGTQTIVPGEYQWRVPENLSQPIGRVPIKEWR